MQKFDQGFDKHLGYSLIEKDLNKAVISLDIKEIHRNIYGYVHGGVYFSLGDIASGYIATENEGVWVTLNGSINYMKAVKEGLLVAEATMVSRSSKTIIVDVNISCDGVLLSKATFTMYRVKKERGK